MRELAQTTIGDQTHPYLQAKQIYDFVRKKMRYTMSHRRARGSSSVRTILEFPVQDEKTGIEYYTGDCHEYANLFVALCRATGIPARTVAALEGWKPWITPSPEDSPPLPDLSHDGLAFAAGSRGFLGHGWAEVLLPDYGWIPVDPQWGGFGCSWDFAVIVGKGRDIRVGPAAPQKESEGYGMSGILLFEGRADRLGPGIWNIARVHRAVVSNYVQADPFPAHAFAEYAAKLYPETEAEKNLARYRKWTLNWVAQNTRGHADKIAALSKAYEKQPKARYEHEAFICHMLRKVVGDKKFSDIFETYTDLRVKSGEPVSTARFQKIAEDIYGQPLGWFFRQWIGYTELPQPKLDAVTLSKDRGGWRVRGNLCQLNDSLFRLPVELALETMKTTERKTIWMETRKTDVEFTTPNRPKSISVDRNDDILKIQKMPPLLGKFWNVYPDLVVVYGTLAEGEANKAGAQRFNKECLRLDPNIVKADVDVNEVDLKAKGIILFGRPEVNTIAQQFRHVFPIRVDGAKFAWQGTTYDRPTQGVAQVVENPDKPSNLIILYAGLSGDATRNFCDLYLYDALASYVIFDRNRELLRGDWWVDNDLAWKFAEDKTKHKP
ncbi:MAG: hypothetical protein JSW59_17595 [Phycisphaerales bacterium]|nr:MAG: hypothetical protein JSW59_17595 [Phycisphaerales bacterium]